MRASICLLMTVVLVACASPTGPSAAIAVTISPQPIMSVPDPGNANDPPGVSWWRAGWSVDVQALNGPARVRSVTSRLTSANGFLLYEVVENAVTGDLPNRLGSESARYPKLNASAAPPTLTVTVTVITGDGDQEQVTVRAQVHESGSQ